MMLKPLENQKAMLTPKQLHAYQHKAIDFIKNHPKCGLFLDMGLGKTAIALTAVADLLKTDAIRQVLIIAPLRVALHTWHQEIAKWSHLQQLSYSIIHGNAKQREQKCEEDTKLHIINRDNLYWLVDVRTAAAWPYDMIILDESASVKNPTSKRFKALKRVIDATSRLVLLTGTPASNGLMDLWSQIYLLDKGTRLGKTYHQFRNRYFISDYFGYTWSPRKYAERHITQSIQDVCLSMQAKDYLSMPKITHIEHKFTLNKTTRRAYDAFKKQFFLDLGEATLTATSAAVLINKLVQFCNGAVYLENSTHYQTLHQDKLDVLAEIIDGLNQQPVLVAYQFKSDCQRLLARFPQAEVLSQSPEMIQRWNDGHIPLLIAHPASCGHGLNLQQGGHNIVWFGLTWSLELYHQMNARLYRQGQKHPVVIHHIIAENTVDELIIQALKDKHITQEEIITALKVSYAVPDCTFDE